ncbi:MAG: septal ring lytic transglycosylase RlpA family protein [Bacillota bacterium]
MRCPRLLFFLLFSFLLAGCGEFPEQPRDTRPWRPPSVPQGDHGPAQPVDVSNVPDAVPGDDTPSRYGNASPYTVLGKTYTLVPACKGYHDRGIASWYGTQFHGGKTSDGETYDMYAMSAANKVVPIPCYARVTNLRNGKSVIVKINDRGPFVENRLIDLSYAAASKLDMLGTGTALVDVAAVGPGDLGPAPATVAPAPAVNVTALPPPASVAPASTAPLPAGGAPLIYLQVGAFAERGNAEAALKKLGAGGIEHGMIVPVTDGARTLYKVRIGPVSDVDAVDALTVKLAPLGFQDAQIVIP